MRLTVSHSTRPRSRLGLLCISLALMTAQPGSAWSETLTADADADVILNGDNDNDRDSTLSNTFGQSVASAGDFNGDGWNDVIVADPSDTNPVRFGGSAYIFFGGQSGTISDPDANADVVLRGQGGFANAVASAGDFNGDGYDDVIVGWSVNDNGNGLSSGSAFVFFGQSYTTQQILDANTDADVVINGRDNSQLGLSVASAGDFDGDGMDDIIVGGGDHLVDGVCGTSVYLLFGADYPTQQVLSAEVGADVVLNAQACNNGFGRSVASAGDFNGDGLDDVIVGAFVDDAGFPYNGIGSAFIFFGGQTGTISDPDSNADVVLNGEGGLVGFGAFGFSVASAGDFNGDGLDDVVVGDQFYTAGTFSFLGVGGAFVFFGGQTGTLVASDADLIVSAQGISDFLGFSVASAGDFNGDGLDDVILGSPGASCEDCETINGNAYIYYGGRTGVFDDPVTSADVVLLGQDPEDFFGHSVAPAGDFDSDGSDDVIVGAPGDNNVAQLRSGAAFVFFGSGSVSDSTPPVVSDLVATPNPVAVGWDSILTAMVSDEAGGGSLILSASYTVDGGEAMPMTAADGSFDEPTEELSAILNYDRAGVFEICVTATDAAGNVSDPVCILVTVYDPGAGFVTGGGFIDSPDGACALTPDCADASGKADFGFVSKYHGDPVTPSGSTEFNFPSGGLNFHSSGYEWLLITGSRAQFKGVGTINGGGDYGFLLTVIDEKLTQSTADDLFRIKIWDRNAGDAVVYDNDMGLADDVDPGTATAGGQIVIH